MLEFQSPFTLEFAQQGELRLALSAVEQDALMASGNIVVCRYRFKIISRFRE